jgi:hypothetical protein
MSSSFPPPSTGAAYPHSAPGAPQHPTDPYAAGHPGGPSPYWQAPMPVAYQPAPQRNGLAIAAIVMSGLALVGVFAVVAFIGIGVASGPPGVLSGTVTPIGKTVVASELERSLTGVIEDDGGTVDQITCPDSSAVGQGLVTVCHGSVDGYDDWTGLVVFEDEKGSYILDEL